MNKINDQYNRKPPFEFLRHLVPLAVIVVLLMLFLPQLKDRTPTGSKLSNVEPPTSMEVCRTSFAELDTLINTGLRSFYEKDYLEAARLLAKARFFFSVKIREGEAERYPKDLLFHLGLAQLYLGQPRQGIPLLEAEEKNAPNEEKYSWYLAHLYIADGLYEKAREKLEKLVSSNGAFAAKAQAKLNALQK